MTLLIPGLLIGAAVLYFMRKGSSSSAVPLPAGTEPPGDGWIGPGAAQTYTVPGGSRATYTMWRWTRGDQFYTVARLAGSTAWLSFTTIAGQSVPGKTNAGSDAKLLQQMRSDWGM